MSRFVQVTADILASDTSDYASPDSPRSVTHTLNPTRVQYVPLLTATAGSPFGFTDTTVDYVVIKNKDITNYVTIAWTTASTSTSTSIRLTAGKVIVLPDVSASNTLTITANTAAVECDLLVVATT